MNLVKVVSSNWGAPSCKYHYVDADCYSRVSKSKSLCGLPGKKLFRPMASYFWASRWCKKCEKKARKK